MKPQEHQNEILIQATSVKDFVKISKKAKLFQFVNHVCKKPGSLFRKRDRPGKKIKPLRLNYLNPKLR